MLSDKNGKCNNKPKKPLPDDAKTSTYITKNGTQCTKNAH